MSTQTVGMEVDVDDGEFELQVGKIGRDRGSNLRRLRAAVRVASWAARTKRSPVPRTGPRAHFAKGAKAKGKVASFGRRRVVVKARYAILGGGKGAPLRAHVAYLAREGQRKEQKTFEDLGRSVDYLSREASEGQARYSFYDRSDVGLDAKEITAGWASDARHFRLIVSAEDGEAMGDLKPFIREVVAGLETKLGTKLEWLAVDHHDTDNPHTHVLIRGKRLDGQDLFIPSKIISSGIRQHAEEIVTRVLGPRLGVDLVKERAREIAVRGVTPLDRELTAWVGPDGFVRAARSDLVARLERLESWGLAQRSEPGWHLADGLLSKLKRIQERAEVEQAIATVRRPGDMQPLLEADRDEPVQGQLVHLGPGDEFGDSFLAVIETGRGELRYARFERADDLAILNGAVPGAIVTFAPTTPQIRPSDEAVARIAERTGGFYSMEHHAGSEPWVERNLMQANVRRLEAMRRAGLVEREPDGVFIITGDHLDKALAFEDRISRRFPVSPQIASYWTLGEQVDALGPTHLDRVLAGETAPIQGEGAFAREHTAALQQRRLFLIEQGWMGDDDAALSRSALQQMARNELHELREKLSQELGKPVLTTIPNHVRGVYARRIDLAQGRVALILQDRHASIVPWRPPLERFAGREVEGLLRGQSLSWRLMRAGPDLPPMG